MKEFQSSAKSNSSRRRWQVVAGLIALAVLMLFSVGTYLRDNTSEEPQDSGTAVTRPSEADYYYFKSGMWLADLRTIVAACEYVLRPEWA